VSTVKAVDIEKVSIIDSGGQGTGVPGFMGQLPAAIISLAEQIENATGVDVLGALRPSPDGATTALAEPGHNGSSFADEVPSEG
jgi:flotillin